MDTKIKLLIIDDFQISALGTKAILQGFSDYSDILVAYSFEQALDIFEENVIDVVLCDIVMPEHDGFVVIEYIKKHYPNTKTIFLSISEDKDTLLKTFVYGADGYQFKDVAREELHNSINAVMRGKKYFSPKIIDILFNEISSYAESYLNKDMLNSVIGNADNLVLSDNKQLSQAQNGRDLKGLFTSRELEIMKLLGQNFSTKEIAEDLNISIFTVSTHRKNIAIKLSNPNLKEMKRIAVELTAENNELTN
jgi:DNA-binding NarL/FixJ family response regulator